MYKKLQISGKIQQFFMFDIFGPRPPIKTVDVSKCAQLHEVSIIKGSIFAIRMNEKWSNILLIFQDFSENNIKFKKSVAMATKT